jgi:hypothetical protein
MFADSSVGDHADVGNADETLSKWMQANSTERFNKRGQAKRKLCRARSNWYKRYFPSKITTDLNSWTFSEVQNCSFFRSMPPSGILPKFAIDIRCEDQVVTVKKRIIARENTSTDNVLRMEFGDTCLHKYINSCCKDVKLVPNIVHYVRYNMSVLKFYEFVSFISVIRFIKPCAILIHGNMLPTGQYWRFVLAISPIVIHVHRVPPSIISGQKVYFKAHAGDVMRIEALIKYGGIYLDTDTVVVKSLDRLRKYPFTMSMQGNGVISSAFIMAEKNATFLQKWLDSYKYEYYSKKYTYNAMFVPSILARKHKDLINIEFGKLSRQPSQTGRLIFNTNSKWKGIYGMHLFSRFSNLTMNIDLVKYFNSTVGSICRHILFGNKELCLR